MSTVIFFHAHPDDEATSTGGSIARAVAEGHRVVVVYGTNGDHGDRPDGVNSTAELVSLRRREAEESARILGTHRVEWLNYSDSGMTGWDANNHPDSFWQADGDEAAGRLAVVVDNEKADVLVGYDWHGVYGHPDHVKVHQVAHAAAELAARRPRVLDATMNRDVMRAQQAMARELGLESTIDPDAPMDDGNPFGMPEAEVTWACDVSGFVGLKRQALAAHKSQVSDAGQLSEMPEDVFAIAFGTEYFVEAGVEGPMRHEWFLHQ